MACLVIRDSQGAVTDVKAPNGESSLLFQELLKHHSGNVEKAVKEYAFTHTPTFQEWFEGSQMVDANGEPKIWYHDVSRALEISKEWQKRTKLKESDDISGEVGNNLGRALADVMNTDMQFTENQPEIDHRELTLQERALEQFTGGAISTISARPCYLYSSVPKEGSVVSVASAEQVKFVDTNGTYVLGNNDDILLPMREDEDVPTGGIAKLYQLKSNLFEIRRDRLKDVNAALRVVGGDQALKEALTKEQAALQDYLYGNDYRNIQGLRDELKEIQSIESTNPDSIAPYIEKEFSRLDSLLLGNTEDADEAAQIIEFLQALANVRLDRGQREHPLYEEAELFDGEDFKLPPAWEKQFNTWGNRASIYDGRLKQRKKILGTDTVNANSGIQEHYGSMTYDEIISRKEGMKDTNWVDMMFMDTANGIFSGNGVIPQVAQAEVNRISEEEESWSRGIAHRIDHLLPGLVKRLKDMGETVNFLGVSGASFDIYQQRTEGGLKTSEMVSKFSHKWQDQFKNMMNRFWTLENASRNQSIEDPTGTSREEARARAYNLRQDWLDDNAKILNPALIPELAIDPELASNDLFSFGTTAEQDAHKAEMVALVGEDYYHKMVAEQEEKIKDYLTQRKVLVEQYLIAEGKTKIEDLSAEAQAHIQVVEYESDPFLGAAFSDAGGKPFEVGHYKAYSSYRNNTHVPLAGKGYYDTNYAVIEQDKILKDFYEVAHEATSGIWDRMDAEMQKKVKKETVYGSEATLMELFIDKDVKFMQAMSTAYRRMIDNMKGGFGINKQDPFARARVNAVTGRPDYTINSRFVQNNISRINNIFIAKSAAVRGEYNSLVKAREKLKSLSRSTVIKISPSNKSALLSLATKHTGLTEDQLMNSWTETRESYDGTPYTVLRIGRALEASIVHDIVSQASFDLPKMLKMFTHASAQYSARKKSLPIIKTMREMYAEIQDQNTTNAGEAIVNAKLGNEAQLTGTRVRAMAQWDNWMNRVILGHQGLREEKGVIGSEGMTEEDYEESVKSNTSNFFRLITGRDRRGKGKIYSHEDKKVLEDLNSAIADEDAEIARLEEKLKMPGITPAHRRNFQRAHSKATLRRNTLNDNRQSLGKNVSGSAVFDMVMRLVRWVGLAYAPVSGMNNVITGQVANSVTAAKGVFFPPEYINELSLTEMIASDTANKAHRKYMTRNAALAKVMMEDYSLLQDAADVLQKSSNRSRFVGLRRIHGFYMLQKGEYYNQAPLAVAVLKGTKILDKNGNESNVWDALTPVYDEAGKKWMKKLKNDFRTPENVASWENSNGEDYFKFKSKIRGVIAATHGDFDPLTGMMAKTTHVGQAAIMFHTFLPRMMQLMFGKAQDNILTGAMGQKGIMWSHTPMTATIQGALVGTFFLGPVGSAIGGAVGYGTSLMWGRKSSLGFMQELLLVNKLLARKMLGIPLSVAEKVTGRKFLTQDREAEFKRMQSKEFDRVDYGNYQANVQIIGVMCLWFGALLLTKAALWDDDDEEDSTARKAHNLLANEFMKLFEESALYSNPVGMAGTVTDFAIIRYGTNVGKAVMTFQGLLEGTDTNLSGSNRGESKSYNAFKKVLFPKIIDEGLGFETHMSRQFGVSPFDHYFWGDEKISKREIQKMRLERRESIEEANPAADDEQIKKMLSKSFGKKRKGETYEQFLKRLSKREESE